MHTMKRLNLMFLFFNAVGIALYLTVASRGWRIPEEHEAIPVTGEPFVWALALPVLGAAILANVVWGGLLLHRRQPRRGLWWLVASGLWLIAIWIDFGHH